MERARYEIAARQPQPLPIAEALDRVVPSILPKSVVSLGKIRAAWPEIAGMENARRTTPSFLKEGVLFVEISHPAYRMALDHPEAVNKLVLLDIVSTMAWGLGYFGMPHILLRFMAIEDEKKLVLSRRIASVWVVIAMTASIVIGVVGLGMTKAGALEFLSGSSSETLIVRIASLIAQHGVLAAVLAGLILAGILAATMSTADSQMLAAASSVSQNILQEFGHMKLTEKQSLFAARLTIICVSVVGVVLARDPDSSVFGIVSFAWAGFGGAFGAVVLCALFWKRCNWQGALAGMLCGGLMVFVWKYLISPLGGVFGIYELLPAFLFSLAACVVVSLATPAPGADIEAEFEAAK